MSSSMQTRMARCNSDNSRGSLIVLEGLDRCGKTLQSNSLVSHLKDKGVSVELWRFPDRTTAIGQMISAYLANESELDDRAIHLLFSANRWEKRSLMESKLRSGISLIVDRYSYSGVAFSAAKGLDLEWCKVLHQRNHGFHILDINWICYELDVLLIQAPEVGLVAPDMVIYLDISAEKASERGGYGAERYEQLEFQKKVAETYRTLYDDSWKIIDGCLTVEAVEQQLRDLAMGTVLLCQNGKTLSKLWSAK